VRELNYHFRDDGAIPITGNRWNRSVKINTKRLVSHSAGVSIIELMLMLGVMAIVSLGVASIFNFGFEGLRHMQGGTETLSLEQLIERTLARPPLC
jgi:hypothetical protein